MCQNLSTRCVNLGLRTVEEANDVTIIRCIYNSDLYRCKLLPMWGCFFFNDSGGEERNEAYVHVRAAPN